MSRPSSGHPGRMWMIPVAVIPDPFAPRLFDRLGIQSLGPRIRQVLGCLDEAGSSRQATKRAGNSMPDSPSTPRSRRGYEGREGSPCDSSLRRSVDGKAPGASISPFPHPR